MDLILNGGPLRVLNLFDITFEVYLLRILCVVPRDYHFINSCTEY